MKKVLVNIFAVIGVIAVIVAILGICVIHVIYNMSPHYEQPDTGVIQKDGSEVFYISHEISGQGGTIFRFLENDGVMLGDSQDDFTVSYGTFIPQKSGRCIIFAEDYFASDLIDERLFDVTVDENLKISYVCRYSYQFPLYEHISFENCQMTVQKDGNSTAVQKETAVEIGNEMNCIYGKVMPNIIDPYLSKFAKVICAHDNGVVIAFYISDDKIYYQENGIENWYEFVPDDFCSLDRINELLDLKD